VDLFESMTSRKIPAASYAVQKGKKKQSKAS
jgi:hypothetical protein